MNGETLEDELPLAQVEDIVVDASSLVVMEGSESAILEVIEDSEADEENVEAKGQEVHSSNRFEGAQCFNYEPLIAKAQPEGVGVNRSQVQVPESIDRLGESVYKLNKYFNLKKDIKAMQKENCVRDDIKKKLDLKERWLSTPSPVESLSNKFTFNSRTLSRDSLASGFSNRSAESTLPLLESAIEALNKDEGRKGLEERFDKIAIAHDQMAGGSKERHPPHLQRSNSLEDLLREKTLKQQKLMQPLKNLESKNFANTMDFVKSQIATPKVKAQDSCDLSKYFPDKKVDKRPDDDVNKTQKPLKDVDLTQYFSTNTPKENVSGDKPPQRPPNLPTLQVEKSEAPPPPKETLNENDFNMFDQLMDGAIDLKIFMKHIQGETGDWSEKNGTSRSKRDSLRVNYEVVKSPSQEYKQFFGNLDDDEDDVSITLDDLIDEHAVSDFESIASNYIQPQVMPRVSDHAAATTAPPDKPIRLSLQLKSKVAVTEEDSKKKVKPNPQKPKRVKSFSKPADPNRGIDSSFIPPRPRTIRSIPGMILNTVKGKSAKKPEKATAKQEVSDKNDKSGTKPKKSSVNSKQEKEPKKQSIAVAEKKVTSQPAIKENEAVKVFLPVKSNPDYVPDPKMAKYFFDDVSILGDIEAPTNVKPKAGHEIFEDALETSSVKRLSDIDRIFERINSEEIMDVDEVREKVATRPLSVGNAGDVQMVDNAIYQPSTPVQLRSLKDQVDCSVSTPKDIKPEVPEKVLVKEVETNSKLSNNSSEESYKSTASRREILMKMHAQTSINEANGSVDQAASLPPTPTPRRRTKSRSTEPTSPIPPRRMKKTSSSGSVDSKSGLSAERVQTSPVVLRREVAVDTPSRKYSEPEKKYGDVPVTSTATSSYSKRRSGDYTDYTSSNYQYRDPIPTSTTYLLSKSKNLHDRKREFMNERVTGNNPYMRRMLSREEREEKISAARSALDQSRTLYSPTTRTSYSGSRMSPFESSSSYYTPSSSSRLNYSTAPSTYTSTYSPTTHSSHSFMDYFRRAPHSPPPSSSSSRRDHRDPRDARDGCVIS